MSLLRQLLEKGSQLEKTHPRIGLYYCVIGVFSVAGVNITIKYSGKLPGAQLIFYRSFVLFALTSFFIQFCKLPGYFKGAVTNRKLYARGLNAFTLMFTQVIAVRILSLSEFQVLSSLSPIFTGIGGSLFLGEKFLMKYVYTFLICFIGLILIAKPPILFPQMSATQNSYADSSLRILGIGMSLINAFTVANSGLLGKSLLKHMTNLEMFHYNGVFMTLLSGIQMLWTGVEIPTAFQALMLLLGGIFEFLGRFFITRALKTETAMVVSLIGYLGIVLTLLADFFLFHIVLDVFAMFGIAIILTGVIGLAVSKK